MGIKEEQTTHFKCTELAETLRQSIQKIWDLSI